MSTLGDRIERLGTLGEGAARGPRMLETALFDLSERSSGLTGTFGSLAESIAQIAGGSPLVLAAAAGIGIIGAASETATAQVKDLADMHDRLAESVRKSAEAHAGVVGRMRAEIAGSGDPKDEPSFVGRLLGHEGTGAGDPEEIQRIQRRIAGVSTEMGDAESRARRMGLQPDLKPDLDQLAELNQRLTELTTALRDTRGALPAAVAAESYRPELETSQRAQAARRILGAAAPVGMPDEQVLALLDRVAAQGGEDAATADRNREFIRAHAAGAFPAWAAPSALAPLPTDLFGRAAATTDAMGRPVGAGGVPLDGLNFPVFGGRGLQAPPQTREAAQAGEELELGWEGSADIDGRLDPMTGKPWNTEDKAPERLRRIVGAGSAAAGLAARHAGPSAYLHVAGDVAAAVPGGQVVGAGLEGVSALLDFFGSGRHKVAITDITQEAADKITKESLAPANMSVSISSGGRSAAEAAYGLQRADQLDATPNVPYATP